MKQSHVQDTTDTLVHAFSYSTRWMCTCLSSSAEKRWWIYSFTFRWRKYDQGRKGPLVNKDSFFLTDQSTTLTNYIWYVYRHMCVLVYIHMYNTCMKVEQFSAFTKPGVGETSKRCKCSYVHMYTGHGITVSWICRSYVRLCILHTPPLLIQSETWPSQSKTKPFLSLPLPVHVSRSLSQSLTFSNQALVVYSWSKRFRPSTTVLTAPWSASLGTPHDVL